MPTLREWLSQIDTSAKKTASVKQTTPLMDRMRNELSSEHPDYSLCLDALAIFPAQVTGMFYNNVYPSLSENVQKEWEALCDSVNGILDGQIADIYKYIIKGEK